MQLHENINKIKVERGTRPRRLNLIKIISTGNGGCLQEIKVGKSRSFQWTENK